MRNFILSLCAFVLVACGGHDMSGVSVTEGVIHPPLPGQTTAVAFFTVSNPGTDDRLVAVMSPLSDTIEIHTHEKSDQGMKMVRLDALDIPIGETALKSGGDHIMIFSVPPDAMPKEAPLTLVFENAESLTVTLPIRPRGQGPMKMDHSGH